MGSWRNITHTSQGFVARRQPHFSQPRIQRILIRWRIFSAGTLTTTGNNANARSSSSSSTRTSPSTSRGNYPTTSTSTGTSTGTSTSANGSHSSAVINHVAFWDRRAIRTAIKRRRGHNTHAVKRWHGIGCRAGTTNRRHRGTRHRRLAASRRGLAVFKGRRRHYGRITSIVGYPEQARRHRCVACGGRHSVRGQWLAMSDWRRLWRHDRLAIAAGGVARAMGHSRYRRWRGYTCICHGATPVLLWCCGCCGCSRLALAAVSCICVSSRDAPTSATVVPGGRWERLHPPQAHQRSQRGQQTEPIRKPSNPATHHHTSAGGLHPMDPHIATHTSLDTIGSAPASSNALTSVACPCQAHQINGVEPSW